RILADPRRFVGQELARFSATPTLSADAGVEPRAAVLRTFLVARDADYAVMPGGLTRVASSKGSPLVSNQAGGSSKDTWVLASEPEQQVTLWLQPAREQMTSGNRVPLSSRAADNLFWLGRYVERAEGTARLLRTILQKYDEAQQYAGSEHSQCLDTLLRSLTHFTATYPGFMAEDAQLQRPDEELLAVACDAQRHGSLAQTLQGLLHSAHAIRDFWSSDTWRVLDAIDMQLASFRSASGVAIANLSEHLNQVVVSMAAFNGLTSERLMRDQAWRFIDMGRRIERSLLIASLTRSTVAVRQDEAVEALLLDAVLSTAESILTYRQRYRSYLEVRTVLELLLLDSNNPRGLMHQLIQLQEALTGLPTDARNDSSGAELGERDRLALEAVTQLRLVSLDRLVRLDAGSVLRHDLDQTLARLTHLLTRMSEVITEQYFGHLRESQQLAQAHIEAR
ncbi:MAG: circularly permuted type 2 ATP-grasp protein, partial [Proteobacteria bacterium]|nr:circularly permuted type 2 ATP-grasp protein [Burkholderiales bacterium]